MGGTGIVSASVTVEKNGALAPGRTSAGTFKVEALTLNNMSRLKFDLGGLWPYNGAHLFSPNELLIAQGDLTLDGQLLVSASGMGRGNIHAHDADRDPDRQPDGMRKPARWIQRADRGRGG